VTTYLENLEKSRILTAVGEMSGILLKVLGLSLGADEGRLEEVGF